MARFWRGPDNWVPVVALGFLSVLVYLLIACRLQFSNAPRDVVGFLVAFGALFALYVVAALLVHSKSNREHGSVATILAFAVIFRIILLFAGLPHDQPVSALAKDLSGTATGYTPFLIYDNDVWRYLWDGHLTASGISPYEATPQEVIEGAEEGIEPHLGLLEEEVWWDVVDNVSFQGYTTVYPPLAQYLFGLSNRLAPASVFLWKSLVVLADLGTCWVLLLLLGAQGVPRTSVLLYAWNPLVIKEFAGSGHADSVMVLLMTLALLLLVRKRPAAALASLALSILAKIGSAALGVLFLRRTRPVYWLVPVVVLIVGSLPMLGGLVELSGGLGAYGREWTFNSGPWAAIRYLAKVAGTSDPTAWAHWITKVLSLLAVVVLPWFSSKSNGATLRSAFLILAAIVLLHPAVMPWYLIWALPLATVVGCWSWIGLTGLSLLSYLIYLDGIERAWWLWLEYGLFAVLVAFEWARARSATMPATFTLSRR
jgi:alpha-1,6-mannosyltransferase